LRYAALVLSEPTSPKDEEIGSRPVETTAPAESKKTRKALSEAKRILTDDELSAPGARKMLLDNLDRLEADNEALIQIRERFYDADKRCAVLETSLRQGQKDDLSTDLIFTGCMTVGGVVLGLLPSLGVLGTAGIWAGGAIGLVLIGIGIAAKIVKYR
jgi:hypothetical protein